MKIMNTGNYKIEVKLSIHEIEKNIWNDFSLKLDNPFYQWEWIFNLEESESVSKETGWQPLYFLVYLDRKLQCIAPLFLKNHSYGEFIFDQSFAKLAEDLNLAYYPKLIGMSPYSPIEGYQFLYTDNIDKISITKLLINYIDSFAKRNGILSCNFLYVNNEWGQLLQTLGYHKWVNIRSEWEAEGEVVFDDFLKRFNSNQRKNIKKERKSIINQNIKIKTLMNTDINENILQQMHFFYEQHCMRWGVWGSKYLTNNFFKNIINNKENIIIFSAFNNDLDNAIAMSMCIKNTNYLWGRYWGSNQEINNLHFELCYYQPIEWCIKNQIKFFDPGAGGKHKRRRGFYAKGTNSLHRWFNVNMENIISTWLTKANQQTINDINIENSLIPFSR